MRHVVEIEVWRKRMFGLGALGVGSMYTMGYATTTFSDGTTRVHRAVTPASQRRILYLEHSEYEVVFAHPDGKRATRDPFHLEGEKP